MWAFWHEGGATVNSMPKVELLQLSVSAGAFEGLDPREAGCRDTMFVVG